jgi:hypothetical protein
MIGAPNGKAVLVSEELKVTDRVKADLNSTEHPESIIHI